MIGFATEIKEAYGTSVHSPPLCPPSPHPGKKRFSGRRLCRGGKLFLIRDAIKSVVAERLRVVLEYIGMPIMTMTIVISVVDSC